MHKTYSSHCGEFVCCHFIPSHSDTVRFSQENSTSKQLPNVNKQTCADLNANLKLFLDRYFVSVKLLFEVN